MSGRKGSRHRRLARVRAAAEVVLGAGRGVDVARRRAARQRAAVVRSALPLALPVRRWRQPARLGLLGVATAAVLVHAADVRLIVDGLVAPGQLASVAHAVRRLDSALGLLCVGAAAVVVSDAGARVDVHALCAASKGTLSAHRDAEHWCAGTGGHCWARDRRRRRWRRRRWRRRRRGSLVQLSTVIRIKMGCN